MGKFLDEEPKLYKGKFLEEQQQSPVMQAVSGMVQSPSKLLGASKVQEYAEQGANVTGQKLLRGVQVSGQLGAQALPLPVPASARGYISAPITAATEYGIQKLQGKENPEALKQAGMAGGLDAAITGGGQLLSKLAIPVTKWALKKAIPFATGISEDSTEIALKNPEIFKGKFDFDKTYEKVGEKAQQANKYILEKVGKAVEAEKKSLKNIKTKYDFSDISNKIDNDIIKTWGETGIVEKLSPLETKKLETIGKKIKDISQESGSPRELLHLRESLDDKINFAKKQGKTTFQKILENARFNIKEKLADISPRFAKVNEKYREIKELNKFLNPKLKEGELYSDVASSNIQNIIEKSLKVDKSVKGLKALEKLDELVPKKMKFLDEAKNAVVRSDFEQWQPKSSTLKNLRLAGAVGGGSYGAGSRSLPVLAGTAAFTAATTPKVYKSLITGGSALKRAMEKPVAQGATKQLATQMLRLYNQE